MKRVFLDAGYLVALEMAADQYHAVAREYWDALPRLPQACVTTSCVLNEVVTFLNSRGHHAKAVQVGNSPQRSAGMELVHVDEPLFQRGWQLFEQHSDKRYSLTDCISFIVMRDLAITTACSFDHHFVQAGFQIEPAP